VARKELRDQEKILKEKSYESQTVCETHLRKVQDHQAQGSRHDHLRESEAQAEAGLMPQEQTCGAAGAYAQPASQYRSKFSNFYGGRETIWHVLLA
jgi:hypothetical protein